MLKSSLISKAKGHLDPLQVAFPVYQGIQELRFYDTPPTSWYCERTSRYLIDLFQHDLAGHCQALGKTFVFHIGNNLSENVGDRDLLRTFINTETALNALGRITGKPVGQISAHADGVAESGGIRLIEHVQLVIHLETDGDRHIGRARHTVSTAGTTHLHQLPVGVGCLDHQLQFCGVQNGGKALLSQGNFFIDVGLLIHPGKDHRNLRVVPDPEQRPGNG